ncbi:unnamed protein product [Diatraea saccharalis]|uniref:BPTI/Kunitz inhibitor domain-containing protein n=1 Tax=Diatraea saccharalis TaxID=40085 RepID=A0A9N9QUD7_9NEOP|nr:unnamed protein product [Diatraea saccharalis]
MKPTPVFYYYKPGSRCEKALWRGCPTMNMFQDQYQCVDKCIYKMFKKNIDENTILPPVRVTKNNTQYSCEDYFNGKKCTDEEISVFTYDRTSDTCAQATWRGCPTTNKFFSLHSCLKYCKLHHVHAYEDWRAELDAISNNDAKVINEIVDHILEDYGKGVKWGSHKLKGVNITEFEEEESSKPSMKTTREYQETTKEYEETREHEKTTTEHIETTTEHKETATEHKETAMELKTTLRTEETTKYEETTTITSLKNRTIPPSENSTVVTNEGITKLTTQKEQKPNELPEETRLIEYE